MTLLATWILELAEDILFRANYHVYLFSCRDFNIHIPSISDILSRLLLLYRISRNHA